MVACRAALGGTARRAATPAQLVGASATAWSGVHPRPSGSGSLAGGGSSIVARQSRVYPPQTGHRSDRTSWKAMTAAPASRNPTGGEFS
jgi:hypothetical protein